MMQERARERKGEGENDTEKERKGEIQEERKRRFIIGEQSSLPPFMINCQCGNAKAR